MKTKTPAKASAIVSLNQQRKDTTKIDIIGELLINNSISEQQFIDGYDLPKKMILEIVSELVADGFMEIIPDMKPTEYRMSNKMPEGWKK